MLIGSPGWGGVGGGGWLESAVTGLRGEFNTLDTQSKRTAKERGGWHCVLTWVTGSKLFIK